MTVIPRSLRFLASRQSDSMISRLWYFPISATVLGENALAHDAETVSSFME